MSSVGSEAGVWRWLTRRSALGELIEIDFSESSHMSLYRTANLIAEKYSEIRKLLYANIKNMLTFCPSIILYDLTNSYFEGEKKDNSKTMHGHSKEKRTDCKIVSTAVILDSNRFINRAKVYKGNISEASTLQEMIAEFQSPEKSIVVMDAGIATEENIKFLIDNQYSYIVVSRKRD
jgi:transposase